MDGIEYGGGIPSVRRKVFSANVSHYQYGGGTTSVVWRMCSTVEGRQYEPVTSSVRMCHFFSTAEGVQCGLSHYQYGGGCAVRISHIISTDEGVQYRTTTTAQGVFGGIIIWGKRYFTYNLTMT